MVKQTLEGAAHRAALYVYPADFELRGVGSDGDSWEAISAQTESQYLIAGARVVWKNRGALSSLVDPQHRITIAITNLIQSTSAVVDLVSGELVEAGGFYPNGAREEQLADNTQVPLEPVSFTGKEADEEVGLTYFGERYLVQRMGRWATPDPAEIHAVGGGEALNALHYVSGNLMQARDPLGLCADNKSCGEEHPDADMGTPSGEGVKGEASFTQPDGSTTSARAPAAPKQSAQQSGHLSKAQFANVRANAVSDARKQAVAAAALSYVLVAVAGLAGAVMLAQPDDPERHAAPNGQTVERAHWEAARQVGKEAVGVGIVLTVITGANGVLRGSRGGGGSNRGVIGEHKPPARSSTATATESAARGDGRYIPRDVTTGELVPLPQQSVKGVDIPTPLPEAQGAHTVLGGRVGSDRVTYRQSATFPAGTWPKANGQSVPWSRVDWSNHGRGDHASPHQHPFVYDSSRGGWIEGPRIPF